MNLRDLIFENPNKETTAPPKTGLEQSSVSFPKSFPPAPQEITIPNPALSCEPYMKTVMELYEAGFDSLNKAGYDFYEYFKAILKGGVDNPLIYDMAFQMAKGMDPSVTKEKLISDSEFYIQELEKVFNNYTKEGADRKANTIAAKKTESDTLLKEVGNIAVEIQKLTTEKEAKEQSLRGIDNKYDPAIQEIDCKLLANQTARDTLVNSIKKVKEGLNTNVNQ